MKKHIVFLVAASLAIAGCGAQSPLNAAPATASPTLTEYLYTVLVKEPVAHRDRIVQTAQQCGGSVHSSMTTTKDLDADGELENEVILALEVPVSCTEALVSQITGGRATVVSEEIRRHELSDTIEREAADLAEQWRLESSLRAILDGADSPSDERLSALRDLPQVQGRILVLEKALERLDRQTKFTPFYVTLIPVEAAPLYMLPAQAP